ncbi:MAG: chemotaxis protein CheW, partial [Gammaproteobacteria bacterium]|nr:chemotaxis protein CheW [Gammaproteobacteria bacterium]
MQGQDQHNKLLLFEVGPIRCCLFSNSILTIIPPPRQETAGHAGRLPAMFRHSNRIARVVDMRTRFGLSPSSPERGKLILAELDKGLVAFWVDRIENVIDQEDGRWDTLPPKLPRDVFTRTFILNEELILHTEPARMEAMSPSPALSELIEELEQKQTEKRRQSLSGASPTQKPEPATQSRREPSSTARPETKTAESRTAAKTDVKMPTSATDAKSNSMPSTKSGTTPAAKSASTATPAKPAAPREKVTKPEPGAAPREPQRGDSKASETRREPVAPVKPSSRPTVSHPRSDSSAAAATTGTRAGTSKPRV